MLTKGQKAEIKDLYDGTPGSVRELAKLSGVGTASIRYIVNYKGFRNWHNNYTKEWQRKNPEKTRITREKASKKWQEKNREKMNANRRKRYWEDPEKYRALSRKSYHKRKLNN